MSRVVHQVEIRWTARSPYVAPCAAWGAAPGVAAPDGTTVAFPPKEPTVDKEDSGVHADRT